MSDAPDAQIRLEVSGIGKGTGSAGMGLVKRRLAQKRAQLKAGASSTPGIAAVVGFELLRILVSKVES